MSDTLAVAVPVAASLPAPQAHNRAAGQLRRIADLAGLRLVTEPVLSSVDDGNGPTVLVIASGQTIPTGKTTNRKTVRLAEADPYHAARVDAVARLVDTGMTIAEIADTSGLDIDEIAALHLEALESQADDADR